MRNLKAALAAVVACISALSAEDLEAAKAELGVKAPSGHAPARRQSAGIRYSDEDKEALAGLKRLRGVKLKSLEVSAKAEADAKAAEMDLERDTCALRQRQLRRQIETIDLKVSEIEAKYFAPVPQAADVARAEANTLDAWTKVILPAPTETEVVEQTVEEAMAEDRAALNPPMTSVEQAFVDEVINAPASEAGSFEAAFDEKFGTLAEVVVVKAPKVKGGSKPQPRKGK
jgi:DNA-binding transcriptional MerR regulator